MSGTVAVMLENNFASKLMSGVLLLTDSSAQIYTLIESETASCCSV
jgi:hypothetical protein